MAEFTHSAWNAFVLIVPDYEYAVSRVTIDNYTHSYKFSAASVVFYLAHSLLIDDCIWTMLFLHYIHWGKGETDKRIWFVIPASYIKYFWQHSIGKCIFYMQSNSVICTAIW